MGLGSDEVVNRNIIPERTIPVVMWTLEIWVYCFAWRVVKSLCARMLSQSLRPTFSSMCHNATPGKESACGGENQILNEGCDVSLAEPLGLADQS
jgi:hypothetical protein